MSKELWQDYLFLTLEMKKFLKKKDYDLFNELMRQRESLQQKLDKAGGDFQTTPEGKTMLTDIQRANQYITQQLHVNLNFAKKQHNVSQAYDGTDRPVGLRLDRQG